MHLYSSCLATIGLAVLLDRAVAVGLPTFGLAPDYRIAAQLGLDPGLIQLDHKAFDALIANASTIPAEYTEIPIDHDNSEVGTYQNRFWVNEEYYTPGSPIFIYDAGETNASKSVPFLSNSSLWLVPILQEFNGMGIVWEHRYYGDSLPFPVSLDTPVEHLQYLTTAQALADIPYFAKNFSRPSQPSVDLTPNSTPWIMIGGSYAGVRAAFARYKYPDTIYASWASSAPVQARIDMGIYYEQVYRGMVAKGYENCAKDIQAALEYVDEQLAEEETAAAIKQLFFGPGAELNSNGNFTAGLGGLYGYFQTYGIGGGRGSISEVCAGLELDPKTNSSAGPEGLASTYGKKFVAERWASSPSFVTSVDFNMRTNCKGAFNASEPELCELNKPTDDPDLISWSWQYCTEWGFYQSNNFGPHALLSRYQTLEYQQEYCNQQFPDAVKAGILPRQPQVESLNNEFGGWTIRPSNVYWSGGQYDPWRTLSVLSTEDFAPQGVNFTTEIPTCGVSTSEDTVFGYIVEGGVHCPDLQASSLGNVSREYFKEALKQWLPCFGLSDSSQEEENPTN